MKIILLYNENKDLEYHDLALTDIKNNVLRSASIKINARSNKKFRESIEAK